MTALPAIAARLGISEEAAALHYESEICDLHVDSFIWRRIYGYDFRRRHAAFTAGVMMSQFDLPRAREAGIGGATWVITTNPLGDSRDREAKFFENLAELSELLNSPEAQARVVRSAAEYRAARAAGLHAAFIGVQGGNALAHSLDALDRLSPGLVLRVTILHLTSSRLGHTSSPLGSDHGLSPYGKDYVRRLNAHRILVDLAHISRAGFWDAVDAHERGTPLVVTHTGVSGVFPHWRNLDDDQLRAVANSGGTIGIMYHSEYLGDPIFGGRLDTIARHIEHVVNVAGEDHVSLGSDWDGSIVTPRDMRTCLELPKLTHALLERGLSQPCIRKVLGLNFLRVVESVRG
ncbi:MAG: Microsomal dipeptidase [Polyangiaceae bacterium]|jgi:membrane dipeptidase|nr:Microsomal dipeptidase [Polyangiaceae bacterium]